MMTQMNEAVLLIYLLNFIFIGLLPKLFFKKGGSFNLMWWLTASPFILCTLFLLFSFAGYLPRLTGYGNSLARVLELVSVFFTVASVALIFFTLGTHRIPIALWHQDNDAPKHIVTYGAYRWIRHPFYASFLLALFGAVVFCPQWGTLVTFIQGVVILNVTAGREETRLSASQFGAEYAEYMRRTGRFWPKLGARSHAARAEEAG
jgi:protein-S-isoprenylcysteine O-methyltransferase Ste14